jgi:hypothetical protein
MTLFEVMWACGGDPEPIYDAALLKEMGIDGGDYTQALCRERPRLRESKG